MEHKKLHEGFAKFFENPTREALRDLLKLGIGETNTLDFKEVLPDKTKLAKHLLAFGNSGGGAMVIGVKDGKANEAVGISEKVDKSDLENQLSPYLPSSLQYEIFDFSYADSEYPKLIGKAFQVIIIESNSQNLPYLCKKSGDGIKDNVIYIRKGTSSTEANHDDIQRIINKRIDTKFSTTNVLNLEEHLEQLKLLYKQIPMMVTINKTFSTDSIFGGLLSLATQLNNSLYEYEPNPIYPKESYQEFVAKTIDAKKAKIKQIIEI